MCIKYIIMNVQVINVFNDNVLKKLGKNLSIPSALHYEKSLDKKNMLHILNNFNCDKSSCCIDSTLYKNLINNVKPTKRASRKIYRKISNRKSKKLKRK